MSSSDGQLWASPSSLNIIPRSSAPISASHFGAGSATAVETVSFTPSSIDLDLEQTLAQLRQSEAEFAVAFRSSSHSSPLSQRTASASFGVLSKSDQSVIENNLIMRDVIALTTTPSMLSSNDMPPSRHEIRVKTLPINPITGEMITTHGIVATGVKASISPLSSPSSPSQPLSSSFRLSSSTHSRSSSISHSSPRPSSTSSQATGHLTSSIDVESRVASFDESSSNHNLAAIGVLKELESNVPNEGQPQAHSLLHDEDAHIATSILDVPSSTRSSIDSSPLLSSSSPIASSFSPSSSANLVAAAVNRSYAGPSLLERAEARLTGSFNSTLNRNPESSSIETLLKPTTSQADFKPSFLSVSPMRSPPQSSSQPSFMSATNDMRHMHQSSVTTSTASPSLSSSMKSAKPVCMPSPTSSTNIPSSSPSGETKSSQTRSLFHLPSTGALSNSIFSSLYSRPTSFASFNSSASDEISELFRRSRSSSRHSDRSMAHSSYSNSTSLAAVESLPSFAHYMAQTNPSAITHSQNGTMSQAISSPTQTANAPHITINQQQQQRQQQEQQLCQANVAHKFYNSGEAKEILANPNNNLPSSSLSASPLPSVTRDFGEFDRRYHALRNAYAQQRARVAEATAPRDDHCADIRNGDNPSVDDDTSSLDALDISSTLHRSHDHARLIAERRRALEEREAQRRRRMREEEEAARTKTATKSFQRVHKCHVIARHADRTLARLERAAKHRPSISTATSSSSRHLTEAATSVNTPTTTGGVAGSDVSPSSRRSNSIISHRSVHFASESESGCDQPSHADRDIEFHSTPSQDVEIASARTNESAEQLPSSSCVQATHESLTQRIRTLRQQLHSYINSVHNRDEDERIVRFIRRQLAIVEQRSYTVADEQFHELEQLIGLIPDSFVTHHHIDEVEVDEDAEAGTIPLDEDEAEKEEYRYRIEQFQAARYQPSVQAQHKRVSSMDPSTGSFVSSSSSPSHPSHHRRRSASVLSSSLPSSCHSSADPSRSGSIIGESEMIPMQRRVPSAMAHTEATSISKIARGGNSQRHALVHDSKPLVASKLSRLSSSSSSRLPLTTREVRAIVRSEVLGAPAQLCATYAYLPPPKVPIQLTRTQVLQQQQKKKDKTEAKGSKYLSNLPKVTPTAHVVRKNIREMLYEEMQKRIDEWKKDADDDGDSQSDLHRVDEEKRADTEGGVGVDHSSLPRSTIVLPSTHLDHTLESSRLRAPTFSPPKSFQSKSPSSTSARVIINDSCLPTEEQIWTNKHIRKTENNTKKYDDVNKALSSSLLAGETLSSLGRIHATNEAIDRHLLTLFQNSRLELKPIQPNTKEATEKKNADCKSTQEKCTQMNISSSSSSSTSDLPSTSTSPSPVRNPVSSILHGVFAKPFEPASLHPLHKVHAHDQVSQPVGSISSESFESSIVSSIESSTISSNYSNDEYIQIAQSRQDDFVHPHIDASHPPPSHHLRVDPIVFLHPSHRSTL